MCFLTCFVLTESTARVQAADVSSSIDLEVAFKTEHHSRDDQNIFAMRIPLNGESRITSPTDVLGHARDAWKFAVETNRAGLVDAKMEGIAWGELSEEEAFHHYQAGLEGVVDSARFLFCFSLVPSLQSGGTPLHIASAGDSNHLESMLQESEDDKEEGDNFMGEISVNIPKQSDGMTPLHFAATTGSLDAVRLLLDRGADVEATSKSGATPLMAAAIMGHVEVVKLLITKGLANPDTAHSWSGVTALHLAAEMGHGSVVRYLCGGRSREDVIDGNSGEGIFLMPPANTAAIKTNGGTALHTAADTNQTEVVRILIQECLCDKLALLEGDTTALYLAAQRGFDEIVRILMEDHSLLNFAMPEGKHSTELAALNSDGSLDLGQFGTEGRPWYPPVNTEVGNGATALHVAVENGHTSVVKILLKAGAAHLPSMQGVTPLLLSLQYRHPQIALLLLDNLENDKEATRLVNLQAPMDGSFPLFVASGFGYRKVVHKLLDSQADVNLKNSLGASALSHAVFQGRNEIVSILLNAEIPPKSVDAPLDDGTTTLHVACERGNLALVEQLISSGAGVNARTVDENRTPLHYAAEGGHTVPATLLSASFYGYKASRVTSLLTSGNRGKFASRKSRFKRCYKIYWVNSTTYVF